MRVKALDMAETTKNGPVRSVMESKAHLVVEVMGPAGTGKTTLSRALRERYPGIAPDIDSRLSKLDKIPFVISDTCSLLPTYLRRYRHSRWFDRRETRSMAYLQAGLKLLDRETPNDDMVTVLDHGPIYRLAFLREFGPEIASSDAYRRWWKKLLERWTVKLDLVVALDAPDEVLLDRIRARDCWHAVKEAPDHEAFEVLRRYRAAFEQTIAESVTPERVPLLRFDTSLLSTEEIADEVLATLTSWRDTGRGGPKTGGLTAGVSSSGS